MRVHCLGLPSTEDLLWGGQGANSPSCCICEIHCWRPCSPQPASDCTQQGAKAGPFLHMWATCQSRIALKFPISWVRTFSGLHYSLKLFTPNPASFFPPFTGVISALPSCLLFFLLPSVLERLFLQYISCSSNSILASASWWIWTDPQITLLNSSFPSNQLFFWVFFCLMKSLNLKVKQTPTLSIQVSLLANLLSFNSAEELQVMSVSSRTCTRETEVYFIYLQEGKVTSKLSLDYFYGCLPFPCHWTLVVRILFVSFKPQNC